VVVARRNWTPTQIGPPTRASTVKEPEFLGNSYHEAMSIDELRSRRHEILSVAARHGARNVRVFGSILRGDDRPDSDIDLLVEVEPGRSLLDVIGLEQQILAEAARL